MQKHSKKKNPKQQHPKFGCLDGKRAEGAMPSIRKFLATFSFIDLPFNDKGKLKYLNFLDCVLTKLEGIFSAHIIRNTPFYTENELLDLGIFQDALYYELRGKPRHPLTEVFFQKILRKNPETKKALKELDETINTTLKLFSGRLSKGEKEKAVEKLKERLEKSGLQLKPPKGHS